MAKKIDIYNSRKDELIDYIKQLELQLRRYESIEPRVMTVRKLSPDDVVRLSGEYLEGLTTTKVERDSKGKVLDVTKTWRELPTMTGLRSYLGIVASTWGQYRKDAAYKDACLYIEQLIEHAMEVALYDAKNPNGLIFGLKNQFGWVDKREYARTEEGEPKTAKEADKEIMKLLDMTKRKKA